MVVVRIAAFGRIDHGFDNAVRHPHADNAQGIPQATVKDVMADIPHPFETDKR
jgi:hypothetical protein